MIFLTFYLKHLDQHESLKQLTGFSWSAAMKFLVACVVTTSLSIAAYLDLVKYIHLGKLLKDMRL